MMTLQTIALVLSLCLVAAILAIGAGTFVTARRRPRLSLLPPAASPEKPIFLFEERALMDATPRARELLPQQPAGLDDWGRFLVAFAPRFPGLEQALSDGTGSGERVVLAEDSADPDSLILTAERCGQVVRIALDDPRQDSRSELVDRYRLAAMRSELSTLRSVAEQAPNLTWKQRRDGTVTWANAAYMGLAREEAGDGALFGWPPPTLFSDLGPVVGDQPAPPSRRVALRDEDGTPRTWFELCTLAGDDDDVYCFATPIDRLVRAESQLGDFVQTLTKTFAHLTVGLAIFDRKRQLTLFNPALTDLTTLPPEFLSSRPTLHAFLDALRDRQRIPEPKDYRSWRLHIAHFEADAADGTFEEVWNLSTGQTYRVTGRPHPGGAVAYMFEDISSEVSLTRSFRSEIEMSQSVLDGLDTAIAVFSQAGILVMRNAAFADLWEDDAGIALNETGIIEATRHWQSRCHPNPIWGDLRGFVLDAADRQAWSGEVTTLGGRALRCDVRPLPRGATMVTFAREEAAAAVTEVMRLSANG